MAWGWVAAACATLATVLTVFSTGYGFERDELYFRMLRPAWGYVDQPPLTPLLGWAAAQVSGSPWAMRVPATLVTVASVVVVVLITRELGGGRAAQALCAWAYAFAGTPLAIGHVLITATLDLMVWPLVCLFVIRALLRKQPLWWVAAGATVGLETYNKLLVSMLVVALVLGLLLTGPRKVLWDKWFAVCAVTAAGIAMPNLLFQATHHWPQLTMGLALSRDNAGVVRLLMWPYLFIFLGPPLVPIWVAGLVALRRRAAWRPLRFLPTALVVLLLEAFLGAGQLYYPAGLLSVVFAAGCVPAAEFLAKSVAWRRVAWAVICLNALASALIALPLLPLSVLAGTAIPAINQVTRDQVGWPEYVAQIAAVYRMLRPPELAHTAVITSNYGEAGAIVRYGGTQGLPRPYSDHNQLHFDRRPPEDVTTVLFVGAEAPRARRYFQSCQVVAKLHNRYGIDNEERGKPIAICRGPTEPWPALWSALLHYG